MTTETNLAGRIAANVRREMGEQMKTVSELADVLGCKYRAAKERYEGKQEYLPSQVEDVAKWLGVDELELVRKRDGVKLEAVA